MTDDKTGWSELCTFSNPAEAHIALGMLENEGITGVLVNQTLSTVITLPWAPVRLLVPDAELGRARRLLEKSGTRM